MDWPKTNTADTKSFFLPTTHEAIHYNLYRDCTETLPPNSEFDSLEQKFYKLQNFVHYVTGRGHDIHHKVKLSRTKFS